MDISRTVATLTGILLFGFFVLVYRWLLRSKPVMKNRLRTLRRTYPVIGGQVTARLVIDEDLALVTLSEVPDEGPFNRDIQIKGYRDGRWENAQGYWRLDLKTDRTVRVSGQPDVQLLDQVIGVSFPFKKMTK